jgi:hypothetical protein
MIMMKEEFETRVDLKVTAKEYAVIEAAYMAGKVNDKDAFCREWLNGMTVAEYKAMKERVIVEKLHPMDKGMFTNQRYMEAVFERVHAMPEFKPAEAIIDYMLAESFEVRKITKYDFNFIAAINYPACEGIYIDCRLSGDFDDSGKHKISMGTVKTLEESKDAMLIMGELTGLLTWIADEFISEQIMRGYFEQ